MNIITLPSNPSFNAALQRYFETQYAGQQNFVAIETKTWPSSEEFAKILGNVRHQQVFLVDSSSSSWPEPVGDQKQQWDDRSHRAIEAWCTLSRHADSNVREAALQLMFAMAGDQMAGDVTSEKIRDALRPHTKRSVNDDLMRYFVTMNALVLASVDRIECVLPFFGYLRQDRKAEPRTPITARLIADMIQLAGGGRLRSVLTSEMHADQEQGFFAGPVDNLKFTWLYAADIKATMQLHGLQPRDIVIISPDVGGDKRADDIARLLGVDQAVFKKRRLGDQETEDVFLTPNNEKISLRSKVAIMVDDLVDSGNSGLTPAKTLKAPKIGVSKIIFYPTHGVLTAKAPRILGDDAIDQVVISNTLQPAPYMRSLFESGRISSINVAPVFAEAMRANARGLNGRDNTGGSVSSLFSVASMVQLCERGEVPLGRHVNCFGTLAR